MHTYICTSPPYLHHEQMNGLSGNDKLIAAVGYFLNVCLLANISKSNF